MWFAEERRVFENWPNKFVFASKRELQEIRQDFLMFIDLEFPSSNMSVAFLDLSIEIQKG